MSLEANIESIPTPWMFWKKHQGIRLITEIGVSAIVGLTAFTVHTAKNEAVSDGGNSAISGLAAFTVSAVQNQSVADGGNSTLALHSLSATAYSAVTRDITEPGTSAIQGLTNVLIPTQRNEAVADGGNSTLGLSTFNLNLTNFISSVASYPVRTDGPFTAGGRYQIGSANLNIAALGFYNPGGNTGTFQIGIWSDAGALLASAVSPDLTGLAAGFLVIPLNESILLSAGVIYRVAALFLSGSNWFNGDSVMASYNGVSFVSGCAIGGYTLSYPANVLGSESPYGLCSAYFL